MRAFPVIVRRSEAPVQCRRWVKTGKAQREQTFSVVPPTSDMRQRGWEISLQCHLRNSCTAKRRARCDQRADDVGLGREVYDDFCVSCRGRDMVAPGGVTFDLRKFPKDDFERFRNAVLNGKSPAMPAWRDKISDDDAKLLWAHVRGGG
jgi:hypothetical protein